MSPDEAIRNLLHYVGDGAGLMRSEHVKFRNGHYDSDSSSSNMEHNYQVQQAIANARAAADQLERVDSAPAGSGGVEDKAAWLERAAAKWEVGPMAIHGADALRLRELAALLRKLQQGAE